MDSESLLGELLGEGFLVDVLREAGTKLLVYFVYAAHHIVGSLDEFASLGFFYGFHSFRLLREHIFNF